MTDIKSEPSDLTKGERLRLAEALLTEADALAFLVEEDPTYREAAFAFQDKYAAYRPSRTEDLESDREERDYWQAQALGARAENYMAYRIKESGPHSEAAPKSQCRRCF